MPFSKGNKINKSINLISLKCEYGKIKVKFKNGKIIECRKDNEVINLSEDYEFICPSFSDFCTNWSHRCPLDCNSNGICLKGNTCHCFQGFSGEDCVIFLLNFKGNLSKL